MNEMNENVEKLNGTIRFVSEVTAGNDSSAQHRCEREVGWLDHEWHQVCRGREHQTKLATGKLKNNTKVFI